VGGYAFAAKENANCQKLILSQIWLGSL